MTSLSTPMVSVIIAAYNAEKYIERAIKSIVDQSYDNIEIIVINDGSADNTQNILSNLKLKYKTIKLFNQNNSGKPACPRNRGIREAKGAFICFLDADDLYEPTKIMRQLLVFEKYPNINLVFHDIGLINHNDKREELSYLERVNFINKAVDYMAEIEPGIFLCTKQFYNFMSTQITALQVNSVMVRRETLFEQPIWFEEEFTTGEDIDLWFRLVINREIIFISEVLGQYRQHSASITKDEEKFGIGSIAAHTRNFYRGKELFSADEKTTYAKRIGNSYKNLAYFYYKKEKMVDARYCMKQAIKFTSISSITIPFLKTYIPSIVFKIHKKLF